MPSLIKRVAVIGTGPCGVAAVRALDQEGAFDTIRVFERRHAVGGLWLYDPTPDVFPGSEPSSPRPHQTTSKLPAVASPLPEDTSYRTATYPNLDSNVGADIMAFSYAPYPLENSAGSILKYGRNNPTRPWRTVAGYLEDLFTPYLHLTSFNTTVEKAEKIGNEWVLTLRQTGHVHKGSVRDYWWQERFDAVVVASGHYSVPNVPNIPGLKESSAALPNKFEHSKLWRSRDPYVGKKVVVVGGGVSAADVVEDLYKIVDGPLFVSQRGVVPALEKVFHLPNITRKPQIRRISPENGGVVEFSDGSKVGNFDKIIFATGYKVSYPFLPGNPVTPQNRLSGFYQHVFNIDDPTLAVIGQVRAALTFRVFEYQSVAVARHFAGRSKRLPDIQAQRDWEQKRLKYKGEGPAFHEVAPDFAEYFNWFRDFAGPPAKGTAAYELQKYQDEWAAQGYSVLKLRDKYWATIGGVAPAPVEKAKL